MVWPFDTATLEDSILEADDLVHRLKENGDTESMRDALTIAMVTMYARDYVKDVPATGKKWDATCSAFYQVVDGRIVDAWVNWDLLTIMEQIGAVRRTEAASA